MLYYLRRIYIMNDIYSNSNDLLYTISGTVVYNDGKCIKTTTNIPISSVPIALQNEGDKSISGAVIEPGIVVKTNEEGKFLFTNIPAGKYRLVEVGKYTGDISETGKWNPTTIEITPSDPPVSLLKNVPSTTNKVNSLTPNTVFISLPTDLVEGSTEFTHQFIDVAVCDIPLALSNSITTGNNLFNVADNGTFGTLPNGTPAQNSPLENPYEFTTKFNYTQYKNCGVDEKGYPSCPPHDGEYSISNIVNNSNFCGWYPIGGWFNFADHVTGDETSSMMIVNFF